MATFKEFAASDVKSSKSFLNQLVDIINTDISSSSTRRKFQTYVTGGTGPGVTSSLFQTIYDQDFTLQTANPVFDLTVGLHTGSAVVTTADPTEDANGKLLFPTETVMMREKIDIYRLFAQNLLGDIDATFSARSGSIAHEIKEAAFFCFKRLFARDQMRRETFAIRLNPTASNATGSLNIIGNSTTKIYTDVNSSVNKEFTFGGQISTVVDSANTSNPVGVLFLDRGVLVLDMSRSLDQDVKINGNIDAVVASGQIEVSSSMKFFLMSASIDDIVDHIASTRFSGSDETSITFQNITNINSSLFFVNFGADEFNYSSNPTYTDSSGRIVVIDETASETQQSFTFVTSVGLYDANDQLLAVSKVSRPLLKDNERNLNLRIRLDF